MKTQLIKISSDFNDGHDLIHCLFCGDNENPEFSDYCKHVTYIYLVEEGEFEFITEDFKSVIDLLRAEIDSNEELDNHDMGQKLLELPGSTNSYVVEISSAGMACGPISFTVLYRFDKDLNN